MVRNVLLSLYIKIILILILSTTIFYQFLLKEDNEKVPSAPNFQDIDPEFFIASDFNKTLPFENGEYEDEMVEMATSFFHLPASISHNFVSCKESREYSCFELIRAYKATKEYINLYENEQTKGFVVAKLPSSYPLHCIMSSFYNAFLISMLTRRRLVLDTDEPNVIWLHSGIKPLFEPKVEFQTLYENEVKKKGKSVFELPSNFSFACEETIFSNNFHNILIVGPCMWPQISYIHPFLAPRLRATFGIHAAFYICNFLFNEFNAMIDCNQLKPGSVACVPFKGEKWEMNINNFRDKMSNCIDNLTVEFIEEKEEDSIENQICMMKKLVSADKIIYSFGSVLGWMSMAMQGNRGAAVDNNNNQCIEFRNSQSGSLVHLYKPDKKFHYSSNNDFLLCGSNYNDARMYERYMMW